MKIGYARASTIEQSVESQIIFFTENIHCDKIFKENVSGKTTTERDQLNEMLNFVREGDVIHVTKVDRLARNTLDALKIAAQLQTKKVGLIFHDLGNLDINSEIGKVIFSTISAFAEMERTRILSRCNAGRALAKSQGKHLGRFKNEKLHRQIKDYFAEGMNKNLIAKTLGCSRSTVYRALN